MTTATSTPATAPEWQRTWRVLGASALVMLVLWGLAPWLHWPSVPHFLIWHQALETLAIAVSA